MTHARHGGALTRRSFISYAAASGAALSAFGLDTAGASPANNMENIKMTVKQTAGRDQLGTFAPTFARINDDVLLEKSGQEPKPSGCANAPSSPSSRSSLRASSIRRLSTISPPPRRTA